MTTDTGVPGAGASPTRATSCTIATYAGIHLISAATLLLQVTFTRIFSVSIWYHFAFLVVSVALFGFGASGVALSLVPRGDADRTRMSVAPLLFGVTALLAYAITNVVPFSPFAVATDRIQIVWFLLIDLLLALPFFFAGSTVVLILRSHPSRAGSLYAWDLIGAAVGTLLVYLLLPLGGARGAVVGAAVLGLCSALALAPTRRTRIAAAAALALSVPFALAPGLLPPVRIDASKPLTVEVEQRGGTIDFTAWNALSRIDVVTREGIDPMILIDSAAMTSLARPVDDDSPYLRNVSTLVYRLTDAPSAVIIGAGGGMDVQNALALGASHVTAVEINPIIIDLVTGRYRETVGDVFRDPRVTLVRDEGRSFVDRLHGTRDVIQLTLIDTWAAGASGAYSLTENYLYTTDAFRAYIEHLTPGGMLSITRWYFETPRLATIARKVLEEMGTEEPGRHVLVLKERISTSFLVKRTPFTREEVDRAREFAASIDGEILYDPTAPGMSSFYEIFFAQPDPAPIITASPTRIDPVSDDAPFFFQMGRLRDLKLDMLANVSGRNFLEPLALPFGQLALVTAFLVGVVLSVILLLVPLAARRVPSQGRMGWLGYFLALGLAFIIVEVVLMQRFALFLGHPTYSVTIVLFAILFFSGLGSAWSERRAGDVRRVMLPVAVLLPLALAVLTFIVPLVTDALIGLPLPARLVLAVLFIAPTAFLMGMPFPVGIRIAGHAHPGLVPWAWAANGCASVVGSVTAVLGAMSYGFSAMLVAAGVVYAVALVMLARSGLRVPA